MKNIKVILDTNLWISFLIARDFSFLDDYVETKAVKLIFSDELLKEFFEVTQRPKFKKYFHSAHIEAMLNIFDSFGALVKVSADINICRDTRDNFLLNLAIDSNADYLVTGDTDLLVLNVIGKTKIVTIKSLMKELSSVD